MLTKSRVERGRSHGQDPKSRGFLAGFAVGCKQFAPVGIAVLLTLSLVAPAWWGTRAQNPTGQPVAPNTIDFSKVNVIGLPTVAFPQGPGLVQTDASKNATIFNGGPGLVQMNPANTPNLVTPTANAALLVMANTGATVAKDSGNVNGQIPITGTGNPQIAFGPITAGTGIGIATGQNSITVSNTSPGAPAGAAGQFWTFPWQTWSTTSNNASALNQVQCILTFVPINLTVNNFGISVITSVASSHVGVGIYNQAGTTLLGQATLSGAAAGLITGAPSGGSFTLTPGWYLAALTTDTTTVKIEAVGPFPAGSLLFSSSGLKYITTAANASTAGVLPSTTGTLTPGFSAGANMGLFVVFQ